MDPVPLTEVYTATPSSKQAQESALLEDASSTRPASPAAIPLTGDFDPDPTLVPTRVAIIGGGISGLAAYWSLLGTHHLVDLFEQTNDLGPWRHSIKADVDMPQIQVQVDREFLNFFQKSSR